MTRWPAGAAGRGRRPSRRCAAGAGCRRWRSPHTRWPSASASRARPGRSAGCPSRSPSTGPAASVTPASSPGRSTPVGAPKPKRWTQSLKRAAPSILPILIAPTLLERARICAVVSVSSGCSVSSWIVRSATWIWSGMLNGRARRDQPRLQRTRDGHHLERRARFVVEADRAVLACLLPARRPGRWRSPAASWPARGSRRCRGSMTIAVASFGLNTCATAPEHVFGALLDVGVERQRQRLARHLAVGFGDRHRLAERVADHPPLPGAAAQQRVARVLEARQPVAFGARPRRAPAPPACRAGRRGASPACPSTPGDLQRRGPPAPAGRQRPREVDEAGALGELRQHARLRLAEQRRQLLRGVQRVARSGRGRPRCPGRARRPPGRRRCGR